MPRSSATAYGATNIGSFDGAIFDLRIAHRTRGEIGHWVVVLQHDHLSGLRSRLVAPLADTKIMKRVERLHPLVTFKGQKYIIAIDQIATVAVSQLGKPSGSAGHLRDEIIAAIDRLFTGI